MAHRRKAQRIEEGRNENLRGNSFIKYTGNRIEDLVSVNSNSVHRMSAIAYGNALTEIGLKYRELYRRIQDDELRVAGLI